MADEPINLVLVQLRELRAGQEESAKQMRDVLSKLDKLDRRIEDLEFGVNQAVGLASRSVARAAEANTKTTGLERKLEDLTARVELLEKAR